MLKLIEADERYLDQYKEAHLLSLEKIKEGLIKKHDLMFEDPDRTDVVRKMKEQRDRTKLRPGRVPSYDYFAVDGDKLVGVIHIRTELTPSLLLYGGHIGYGINPKYWRQGYGTRLLKLGLEKAPGLIKEERVLITCDDDNVASSRVIEKNGGVLENKVFNTDGAETFLTRRYRIKIR